MLTELFRGGSFDPDMKSLYDCGMFLERGAVTLKHLDIAGFTCDPRVVKRLAGNALRRIESMKDFRYIARSLHRGAAYRSAVFQLREELEQFYDRIGHRTDWGSKLRFASVSRADEIKPRFASRGAAEDALVCQVTSTAKFGHAAPIGRLDDQTLMQRLTHYGRGELIPRHAVLPALGDPSNAGLDSAEVTFLVDDPRLGRELVDASTRWLPHVDCTSRVVEDPKSLRLLAALGEHPNSRVTRVVMPVAGDSSRLRLLLAGGGWRHKSLMPIFGRPLFVHSLTQMLALTARCPGMRWVVSPDTVVFWGREPCNFKHIVVPLVPAALRMLSAGRGRADGRDAGLEAVGKFLARWSLAVRTGGYSLPSVLGVHPELLPTLSDPGYGDGGVRDFWEYIESHLSLSQRYARREVSLASPELWFDVDTPARLKSLYDYGGAIGVNGQAVFAAAARGSTCVGGGIRLEQSLALNSTVSVSPEMRSRILFRKCVFDHSDVVIEIPACMSEVVIEGLVVANSCVNLRVNAVSARHVMIYNVGYRWRRDVTVDLDCQVIAEGRCSDLITAPLTLHDFSWRGRNEVLQCSTNPSDWEE
jgi:hypothetical protein